MKVWVLTEFWDRRDGFSHKAFDSFKQAKAVAEEIMSQYWPGELEREETNREFYISRGSEHEVFVHPLDVRLSAKAWSPR